ncbi:MAG: HAD family phosphatase [Atopobiaceae bacterium]|jgi:HAD superfamily hydrolase (TIGR01509 family)|nr:HAD family phosphatase [Atopobiaceae bacterium]MCI2172761.1 HAD family phosphatase [Atopobiaceae bacterium]MCI2207068.1 HAD family phosphatase [Atopobiaceae bacterium]
MPGGSEEDYDIGCLWPFGFEAAIFDFDGTLASSNRVWNEVDRRFMAERDIDYTPDMSRELAALGFADGARFVIDRFGLDESVEDICAEWNDMGSALYAEQVSLRPGAERYLRALRRAGVPLALATTNAPAVLDSLKPRVDIDELFDVRVHGVDVARSKHFPDIYLEAARRLGVDPDGCAVFEDIVCGLAAAQGVGMFGVGVRSTDPEQDSARLALQSDLWLEGWEDIEP